jgi:hypothetical protein
MAQATTRGSGLEFLGAATLEHRLGFEEKEHGGGGGGVYIGRRMAFLACGPREKRHGTGGGGSGLGPESDSVGGEG